jgi:transcriptional regulator with XRE-family HTH domain
MSRRKSGEVLGQRQAAAARARLVLDQLYGGNQSRLARDVGVSQSLISKVARGERTPGRKLLEALARLPGVRPEWALRGEGAPFAPTTRGTLPVALGVLPGWPERFPERLTGQRHPIAEALERASRYWMAVPAGSPLTAVACLALLPGDLILFDANPDVWESNLEQLQGRLFGVKLHRGAGCSYEVGRLTRDEAGPLLDLFGAKARLAEPPTTPPPAPREDSQPRPGRAKRRVFSLRHPGQKDDTAAGTEAPQADRRAGEQPAQEGFDVVIGSPPYASCLSSDLVAVQVYMVRP